MTSQELQQNKKNKPQKAYQNFKKQQQQNVVKAGAGQSYSYKTFFIIFLSISFSMTIALFPLVMAIESFFSPSEPFDVTLFIIGLLLEAISITIIIHYTKKNSRKHDSLLEGVVLKRAFNNKGIVKEEDFHVPPLSRWRSNRTIKKFLRNGTMEIKENNEGDTIYFIPHVISVREKQGAKSVFDFE
ncbi:hypothetical protein FS935_16095 [Metabacillus litoralis]|uniref:Uncharacterized protein n=1 Tax=Metabacillus litoralis TaxID=152268 RepID=A0A5C6VZ06_9BACI|nr:hypothetical protein [Metabacillus litoralis]TXC89875.1 hypothetical protein FS935_16095 [Metabacillus litoralis]